MQIWLLIIAAVMWAAFASVFFFVWENRKLEAKKTKWDSIIEDAKKEADETIKEARKESENIIRKAEKIEERIIERDLIKKEKI